LIDGPRLWMVSPEAGSRWGAELFLAIGSQSERVTDSSGWAVAEGCDPADSDDPASPAWGTGGAGASPCVAGTDRAAGVTGAAGLG
jgi:hypothetical protein